MEAIWPDIALSWLLSVIPSKALMTFGWLRCPWRLATHGVSIGNNERLTVL
jgi:hypothetical protein